MKHLCSLLFSIFFLGGIYGQAQTSLQYNLEKDEVFAVKQVAEQTIVQDLEGATHELTNKMDGVLEFKVVDELESDYKIEFSFKDINLKVTSSIQGEIMNIKAKEVIAGDIQSQIFNSLLNSPVYMTLAKNGDILNVVGGDSLIARIMNIVNIEDEFYRKAVKSSMEKDYGSEALSGNYEQMTFIYPEKDIQVGDTWENEYQGKLKAKNIWKLDTINDSIAEISGTADVVMDIKDPSTTMKLTGTQDTKITTNVATGFILKMVVEGLAEGTSTMAQLGDQEIPTSIKSTITYELITE